MSREVFSLSPDKSVESAAWRLSLDGMSGAPVRNTEGNVIGVLTASDLIDPFSRGETVGEVMTPTVWAVPPEAPVIDAVRLMVEKQIHRAVVLNGSGKIVGIVTTMDVLRALADGQIAAEDIQSTTEEGTNVAR